MPEVSKKPSQKIEPQARDFQIFRALFESRLMTLNHIKDLYFRGSYEAAKKGIQRLKAAGYLRDRGVHRGRDRQVYEPSILYLTKRSFDALSRGGHLHDYPHFTWKQLEKRIDVSPLTIPHEIEVLDVKTALSCAIARTPELELREFLTWPRLYEFTAAQPPRDGYASSLVTIRPDGFLCIHEQDGEEYYEHFLFLELDRSTEHHETLALRFSGYHDYERRGGLAEWYGEPAHLRDDYTFRVLVVLHSEERRNNLAERLLQNNPPVLRRAWLTTYREVTTDPLGSIWMRPLEYREITRGTEFDPSRERTGAYRRRKEREEFVAGELHKLSLFEVE
jgi:hypothetical protein